MGGVIATHKRTNSRSYKNIVDQYGKRCQWLKNEKFLKDLEGDSVDTEILDEELRILEAEEPQTCRGKTAKFLETSPMQIAVCVLILIDAGIVIAEILLDLHAMRSQQREAADALRQTLDFIREQYRDDLSGYHGDDVQYILEKLRLKYQDTSAGGKSPNKRCFEIDNFPATTSPLWENHPSTEFLFSLTSQLRDNESNKKPNFQGISHEISIDSILTTPNKAIRRRHIGALANRIPGYNAAYQRQAHNEGMLETKVVQSSTVAHESPSDGLNNKLESFNSDIYLNNENSEDEIVEPNVKTNKVYVKYNRGKLETFYAIGDLLHTDAGTKSHKVRRSADATSHEVMAEKSATKHNQPIVGKSPHADSYDGHSSASYVGSGYAEKLLKIAHILHFASIAILGVFVLQVFLKLFCMGTEFFKSKLEIFDGIIIIASFTLDLVFVEGISGAEGEEAIALLIIFLLWRILRVINGILVTSKKRQEFRIKLQRRACRRAEKKIESLEDDISWKDKEIHGLKTLCLRSGATEEDIESAQPKRRPFFSKMNTSSGLSSIASLSLGFTMSMRPPNPAPPGVSAPSFGSSTPDAAATSSTQNHPSRPTALQRQQTVTESPSHFRRAGTCGMAPKQGKDDASGARGCGKAQSFLLKRIHEEHGNRIPLSTTPTTVLPVDDTARPQQQQQQQQQQQAEEDAKCLNHDPVADLSISSSADNKTQFASSAPTGNKLTASATTSEVALLGLQCDRCDRLPEAAEPDILKPEASFLFVNETTSGSGKGGGGDCSNSCDSKKHQATLHRSPERVLKWFRWRNNSSVKGSHSSANENQSGIHVERKVSPAASLKRWAWKNTLRRQKRESSHSTDV